MTIQSACTRIASLRGEVAAEALACLKAAQVGSPATGLRYHALLTRAMETPDLWDDDERAAMMALLPDEPAEPERRTEQLNLRLTEREREVITGAAAAAGETMTQYLITAALARAARDGDQ